ncbi:MAG: hypothetical protein AB1894_17665 [Chloroflexota bacterium]
MSQFDQVFETDLPEIEKLSQGFYWVTAMYIESYQNQAEICRAMQDRDALVKEQIKLEMMKTVREIFDTCYFRATGRQFKNE